MNNLTDPSSHPFKDICIISDLDDTLLNSEHDCSIENRKAIDEFIELGGNFGIATGRGIQSVEQLNIPSTLPAILYNGSTIYDISNQKLIWNRPLGESASCLIEQISRLFPEAAIEIFTFDGIYLLSENRESSMHTALERITPLPLENNDYRNIASSWQKILIAWDSDHLTDIEHYLSSDDIFSSNFKFHRSYDFLLEIIHPDCGKEVALTALSDIYKLPLENIIAIGDNQNDLRFLQTAGTGLAVHNALETVQQIADHIIADNDHNIMVQILSGLKHHFGIQ